MSRIVVTEMYLGELGWEVGGWVPYCRRLADEHQVDRVVACCRAGYEPLYEFADEHVTVVGTPSRSICHTMQRGVPLSEGMSGWRASWACRDRLAAEGHDVAFIPFPRGSAATIHRLPLRRGHRYEATVELGLRWRERLSVAGISGPFAAFCVRSYRRAADKDIASAERDRVFRVCHEVGLSVVGIGAPDPGLESGVGMDLDLQGQTSIGDLIAIFGLSALAIGRSTGTLHLASACGLPHIVWMSQRMDYVERRYRGDWNDHGTAVAYHHGVPPEAWIRKAIGDVRR